MREVANIGMTIILISFSMLFATFFLVYILYRSSAPVWPPMGMPKASLFFPTLSTLIVGLSSYTYSRFQKSCATTTARPWFYRTLALGGIFLLSQVMSLQSLQAQGLYLDTGFFSSLLHVFIWNHAVHVIAAVFSLLWLLGGHRYNNVAYVANVGKFWHFLGVIWGPHVHHPVRVVKE